MARRARIRSLPCRIGGPGTRRSRALEAAGAFCVALIDLDYFKQFNEAKDTGRDCLSAA